MKKFLVLLAVAGMLGATRSASAEVVPSPKRSVVVKFAGRGFVQNAARLYVDDVYYPTQSWTEYDSKGSPYAVSGITIDDTHFPTQHCVRVESKEGSTEATTVHVHRWVVANSRGSGSSTLVPAVNAEDYRRPGNHWMITAADSSVIVTQTVYMTFTALYVDPKSGGDDASHDGTKAKPFRTPLYAAAQAVTTNTYVVVYCAPGDYNAGSYEYAGMKNRLYDYNKQIRFVGAGAGKSVLYGKLDLESATHLPNGRGPNAMRAAAFESTSFVQNFTVRDGRNASVTDGNLNTDHGGAGYRVNFADCFITNCAANRGQTIYSGSLLRCRIVGCGSPLGTIRGRVLEGSASARACVFGPQNEGVENPFNDTFTATHCTAGYTPVDANNTHRVYGSGANAMNCVSIPSDTPSDSWNYTMVGCVTKWLNPPPSAKLAAQDVLDADPVFIDKSAGDYRLFATSPAIGYGKMPDDYYYKSYSSDVNGNPVHFKDGRPTAGAEQSIVQGVLVSAESPYCKLTKHGIIALKPGESMTVEIYDYTRRPLGFIVNGAFVPGLSYTYTLPAEGSAESVNISDVVFSTDWYVDAVGGNDANDGFTPETAKRTLKAAMACTLLSGDVIHAAEGDYAEGFMMRDASDVTKNRVVVKSGVTLQADGARAKTRIVGADAPTVRAASYPGCGEGATRCACVNAKGVLRGFTLTGGRTEGDVSGSAGKSDCYGGGVLGYTGAVIEDCFITDCVGRRGNGGCGGRYNGCRFIGLVNDPVTSWSSYGSDGVYSCYFDWFTGNVSYSPIVHCFIGDKNHTGGTRSYAIYATPAVSHGIRNTICLASIYNTGAASADWECTNTVYTGVGGASSVIKSAGFGGQWTRAQIVAGLTTDADGYWTLPGKNSVFVDKDAQASARGFLGETDIVGTQRVYNRAADIGPWEYDWRPDFEKTIGYGGVTIPYASPDVTTNLAGKVRLAEDATAVVKVPSASARQFSFDAVEGGVLTAKGGLSDQTFTEACVYKFKGGEDCELTFSFLGAGGWADFGKIINVPVSVLIVR